MSVVPLISWQHVWTVFSTALESLLNLFCEYLKLCCHVDEQKFTLYQVWHVTLRSRSNYFYNFSNYVQWKRKLLVLPSHGRQYDSKRPRSESMLLDMNFWFLSQLNKVKIWHSSSVNLPWLLCKINYSISFRSLPLSRILLDDH